MIVDLQRFLASEQPYWNELEKYLVDAPTEPMARGSKILGTVLIVIGLSLLTLVLLGFLGI